MFLHRAPSLQEILLMVPVLEMEGVIIISGHLILDFSEAVHKTRNIGGARL